MKEKLTHFKVGQIVNTQGLKGSPDFYLGASVTPEYSPIEVQLLKMKKKIKAGAKFFQTQDRKSVV